jgi:hypothetical protein
VGGSTGGFTPTNRVERTQGGAGPCGSVTPTVPAGTNTSTPTASPTQCGAAAGWVAGPDFPTTMVRAIGFYYPTNGHFYTVGGRSSDAAGSDLQNPYDYNPSTNTWTQMSSTMPDNYMNNMAGGVLNIDGGPKIIAVGGSFATGTDATGRVAEFDPVANTITTLASDPWPGVGTLNDTLPGGYAVFNGKLYIFGGFEINVGMVDTIWQFDPTAAAGSRWTQKSAHLPVAEGYIPTAVIGNYIYLAGGSTWDGTTILDSTNTYRYDPTADTIISSIAQIPRATAETRALTMNGQMWVLGGGRDAPNPNNEVDIYDPGSDSWSVGTPFVNPRRNFPADTDGSTIWLVGGYAPTTATASMEIYHAGVPCGTATPTQPAATSTSTSVVSTSTSTATAVSGTPTNTSTPCSMNFSDVHPSDYFYEDVRCVYCLGAVSGYADGTFRPFNNTTRGQMSKIITIALQIPIVTPTGTPTFNDVPPGSPFYDWIETLAALNIVSGYADGSFRPNNYVTRGQLSKIDALAANHVFGWEILNPATATFNDVPPGSAFFEYIETVHCHDIVSGYADGSFRPGNNAIRAQIAKIVCRTSQNLPDTCPQPSVTPGVTDTPQAVKK